MPIARPMHQCTDIQPKRDIRAVLASHSGHLFAGWALALFYGAAAIFMAFSLVKLRLANHACIHSARAAGALTDKFPSTVMIRMVSGGITVSILLQRGRTVVEEAQLGEGHCTALALEARLVPCRFSSHLCSRRYSWPGEWTHTCPNSFCA